MTGSRIATVVLGNGPRNLLNPTELAGVVERLREAESDATVSGIILTGEGDVFCGGLDLDALQAGGDAVEFATSLVGLLKILPKLTKPIAALVNGDAVASGASLVAACDYAVAVQSARLGTFEVSVGIWPMVAQVPLVKRLGARVALENIGSGEPFSAMRALEVGLVNALAESTDDARAGVESWLGAAARGGAAVAIGRPSAYLLEQLPYEEALDRGLSMFSAMFQK